MAGSGLVDLASPTFWLFVVVAVLVVNIVADEFWYRRVRALLNLGFCALILGLVPALGVGLLLLLLHAMARPRAAGIQLRIAGTALAFAALFLLHKLSPDHVGEWTTLKQLLVGIGFSYVALRGVEYLRAAASSGVADFEWVDTINYLIPFHMLAAGPIQAVAEFRRGRTQRAVVDGAAVLEGVERIAKGLFKKFVLANGVVATLFLTGFESSGMHRILEIQAYYLYIYLDFSAYTDIAIGVGRLMGVSTPENFSNPLAARNIIVFWERWHISLSQFIRRNIFIPLQLAGMRMTQGRFPLTVAAVAFTVAFVSCGLWHEISLRFLAWGGLHALSLTACSIYRQGLTARLGREGVARYMQQPLTRLIATVVTFEVVALSLYIVARPTPFLAGV